MLDVYRQVARMAVRKIALHKLSEERHVTNEIPTPAYMSQTCNAFSIGFVADPNDDLIRPKNCVVEVVHPDSKSMRIFLAIDMVERKISHCDNALAQQFPFGTPRVVRIGERTIDWRQFVWKERVVRVAPV